MKGILLLATFVSFFSSPAFADNIGRLSCSAAKPAALRGAKKDAVVKFINATRPTEVMDILPVDLVEFGWAKTGAAGSDDFLALFDFSGRGYANRLWIYRCARNGSLRIQEIEGWKMGNLKQIVRDLNSDGQHELIITKELGLQGSWQPLMGMPAWPRVYRLENGEYAEASRDFSNFYDNEILPQIDKRINSAAARLSREPFQKETVAVAEIEKYKILRVLGRNPTAALDEAYKWMDSGNSQLIQCAIATFADIGGHEKELRTARAALKPALDREMAAHPGG